MVCNSLKTLCMFWISVTILNVIFLYIAHWSKLKIVFPTCILFSFVTNVQYFSNSWKTRIDTKMHHDQTALLIFFLVIYFLSRTDRTIWALIKIVGLLCLHNQCTYEENQPAKKPNLEMECVRTIQGKKCALIFPSFVVSLTIPNTISFVILSSGNQPLLCLGHFYWN